MPHNLNIVLLEPQIPNNTGSIGRVCLATESTLHLVEPLGFDINDKQLRRAGLDYWKHLRLVRHKNIQTFFKSIPHEKPWVFFSTKGKAPHYEHQFQEGSYLVFGSETRGIPPEVLQAYPGPLYRVPQYDDRVRSLNLANVASIVIYEAIRQLGP